MGSPLMRTLMAGDRDALPTGVPMDKIIETMIKVYAPCGPRPWTRA